MAKSNLGFGDLEINFERAAEGVHDLQATLAETDAWRADKIVQIIHWPVEHRSETCYSIHFDTHVIDAHFPVDAVTRIFDERAQAYRLTSLGLYTLQGDPAGRQSTPDQPESTMRGLRNRLFSVTLRPPPRSPITSYLIGLSEESEWNGDRGLWTPRTYVEQYDSNVPLQQMPTDEQGPIFDAPEGISDADFQLRWANRLGALAEIIREVRNGLLQ